MKNLLIYIKNEKSNILLKMNLSKLCYEVIYIFNLDYSLIPNNLKLECNKLFTLNNYILNEYKLINPCKYIVYEYDLNLILYLTLNFFDYLFNSTKRFLRFKRIPCLLNYNKLLNCIDWIYICKEMKLSEEFLNRFHERINVLI